MLFDFLKNTLLAFAGIGLATAAIIGSCELFALLWSVHPALSAAFIALLLAVFMGVVVTVEDEY